MCESNIGFRSSFARSRISYSNLGLSGVDTAKFLGPRPTSRFLFNETSSYARIPATPGSKSNSKRAKRTGPSYTEHFSRFANAGFRPGITNPGFHRNIVCADRNPKNTNANSRRMFNGDDRRRTMAHPPFSAKPPEAVVLAQPVISTASVPTLDRALVSAYVFDVGVCPKLCVDVAIQTEGTVSLENGGDDKDAHDVGKEEKRIDEAQGDKESKTGEGQGRDDRQDQARENQAQPTSIADPRPDESVNGALVLRTPRRDPVRISWNGSPVYTVPHPDAPVRTPGTSPVRASKDVEDVDKNGRRASHVDKNSNLDTNHGNAALDDDRNSAAASRPTIRARADYDRDDTANQTGPGRTPARVRLGTGSLKRRLSQELVQSKSRVKRRAAKRSPMEQTILWSPELRDEEYENVFGRQARAMAKPERGDSEDDEGFDSEEYSSS
ncbi:hypothetical protein BN14_10452 [Rhizoctonia solani AG-1 IB]|uniref:Uncharacterized protein n=1 Tax=Thanatephorus cucumeris (strain AG1-IB / isolate 7/3/14) TaxID=1108050 RepID=M5CAH2_THACB|nr:hypothetical protein BN14_10452 [Rhizoctonia solani AG-1 IB]